MHLRILIPDESATEIVIRCALVRLGRDPNCEVPFDPDAYPMVSGRHARLDQTTNLCILTPLSQTNKTLLNDRPVEEPVPVKVGDRIRLGVSGPTVEIASLPPLDPPYFAAMIPAAQEGSGNTVRAEARHFALLRGSRETQRMSINKGGVIGRAAEQVEFVLDHPHVSRRHARLVVDNNRVSLRDLGSANGTFVNGRRLTRPVELKRGDRIEIGPFSLQFDGEALVSRSRSNNIELVSHNLKRVVRDRATGKTLTLLHDINLVIRPREFVCLLGPSGSGKSTLLALLSGRTVPDSGCVKINGEWPRTKRKQYGGFEKLLNRGSTLRSAHSDP